MIKNWILKILILSNILLGLALWFFYSENKNHKKQAESYKSLYDQSKGQVEKFKDKQGNEHLKETPAVVDSKKSLKDDPEFQRLVKIVEGLNARNAQSISNTSTTTEYHIVTQLKDSIIHDTIHHNCINEKSKWFEVNGCDGKYDVKSKDSIAEVVFWERKKILFLKIGKKQYEREIINFNPKSSFEYSKSIIFKRK